MEIDENIKSHMAWINRLLERPRIHLGGLEECINDIYRYIMEIVDEKNMIKAANVKYAMAMYNGILEACRRRGAGFMLGKIEICMHELDRLLEADKITVLEFSIKLPDANWSISEPITGKIALVPENEDLSEINNTSLISLRADYTGLVIYVLNQRPSCVQISQWPDKNSVLISSRGSDTSEEMNFARSEGVDYINGAGPYFEELVSLEGKIVRLLPFEKETLQNKIRLAEENIHSIVENVQDEIISYINSVVSNPINRELGYIYLAWCIKDSETGKELLKKLGPVVSTKRFEDKIKEGRLISPKDYPEDYKLKPPSEPIRALARFATAREKDDFEYAMKVARAFPCEPLVQALLAVLSEDRKKVSQ